MNYGEMGLEGEDSIRTV